MEIRDHQEIQHTAADYLAALQEFMDHTAELTRQQQVWAAYSEPLWSEDWTDTYDDRLEKQVEANLELASLFIQRLGNMGMQVAVRGEDDFLSPVEGLGFETDSCQYAAGVITAEGPEMLPLDGSVVLTIVPRS